ncbi:hypothetical protein HKCCE2091_13255 [Rhodobacterales bacterium HKCCE2091]|nr:hypothetical protein [Rhodobacterales bacterium HKCCE2091]
MKLMLAAASPKHDDTLETIKLILSLQASGNDVPESLSRHLVETLAAAIALIREPVKNGRSSSAETIMLAISIHENPEALTKSEEIIDHRGDLATNAQALLRDLEESSDPQGKPSHFSGEVYAAI